MQQPKARYHFREYEEEPSTGGEGAASAACSFEAQLFLNFPDASLASNAATAATTATWKIQQGTSSSNQQQGKHNISWLARKLLQTPVTVAKDLFLPIGFPTSVRPGYLEYQIYDSLQGLCSYLRGVLCSAQILQAAGVGDEAATAWGAALTWALKDGMGMLGGLVFSYMASPLFDAHVKEFRLFADLINDVALTLDMLAPYCRQYLLLISSASTLCKTLCGMSAAATKANITVYFALQGNMADLNSKEATQETLVSLLGMLCGVTIAKWIGNYEKSHPAVVEQIQWTTFLILTAIHVWANWKGVSLLRLTSLNRERVQIVLANACTIMAATPTNKNDRALDLVAPTDVNESLVSSATIIFFAGGMRFNARLQDIMAHASSEYNLEWFVRQKYLVACDVRGDVHVCLLRGATNATELQAFCHALAVRQQQQQGSKAQLQQSARDRLVLDIGQRVARWFAPLQDDEAAASLPAQLASAGWDVEGRLYLGFSRRRTELIAKKQD